MREEIWATVGIREALLMAKNHQVFVELTFRSDEDEEVVLPFNWIESVSRTRFKFKPSAIDLCEAPISRVVRVIPKADETR